MKQGRLCRDEVNEEQDKSSSDTSHVLYTSSCCHQTTTGKTYLWLDYYHNLTLQACHRTASKTRIHSREAVILFFENPAEQAMENMRALIIKFISATTIRKPAREPWSFQVCSYRKMSPNVLGKATHQQKTPNQLTSLSLSWQEVYH